MRAAYPALIRNSYVWHVVFDRCGCAEQESGGSSALALSGSVQDDQDPMENALHAGTTRGADLQLPDGGRRPVGVGLEGGCSCGRGLGEERELQILRLRPG